MEQTKEKNLLPEKLRGNDMAHDLIELPEEIDKLHKKIAEKDVEIGMTKMKIDLEEDKLKKSIYFDDKNTNKEKRDVALREKVNGSVEIIELKEKLKKSLNERDADEIQLKYLYNKFTAIKYLIRLLEASNQ